MQVSLVPIELNFQLKITHRKAKEADPTNWPSNVHYEYSKRTSNSSLRPHIEKYHRELFLSLAKEKGWTILLPGLVSEARSQAVSEAAVLQAGRAKFDEPTFHQRLLNFIVADDQVQQHLFYFS
jgi:hypothetical protein